MALTIGIVGLPNVGKSTLFNALTKNRAPASNYPFCTIDPNVGIVNIPDQRLEPLAHAVAAARTVPATVSFVDIAGLVAGASKGEGLGNRFLAHIREVDAIAEVVREFHDENVVHVTGKVDPKSDIETIKIELILADLETMTKRVAALEKDVKRDSKAAPQLDLAKRVSAALEEGIPARDVELKPGEESVLKSFQLLSAKPHIYVLNIDESHLGEKPVVEGNVVRVSAKLEAELAEFPQEEEEEYLADAGQAETGLEALIHEAYDLLGLESFFTASEKEVRAWTIRKGWTAKQAAGVVHTDFERGFIKAEVINWKELVDAGGWVNAAKAGKVRLEGKDYVVAEGDVLHVKFNV